ncbi:MAG TPA: hypothetical protein VNO81_07710, partial [Candidatus Nitrosotenuis sp.]|nr:hypothetical protein [Candidatus Nitrosotenuis sp.]
MRRGALLFLIMAVLAAPALGSTSRSRAAASLDAPNGVSRWSGVLGYVVPGKTFNLYVTPLEQHLGDSLYSTEIQIHFGRTALAYTRTDPRIINRDISDPNRLPPIWDLRFLVGQRAAEIADPRVLTVGAAGLALEDRVPFLVQAFWSQGHVTLYHRLPGQVRSLALARFRYSGPPLAV